MNDGDRGDSPLLELCVILRRAAPGEELVDKDPDEGGYGVATGHSRLPRGNSPGMSDGAAPFLLLVVKNNDGYLDALSSQSLCVSGDE